MAFSSPTRFLSRFVGRHGSKKGLVEHDELGFKPGFIGTQLSNQTRFNDGWKDADRPFLPTYIHYLTTYVSVAEDSHGHISFAADDFSAEMVRIHGDGLRSSRVQQKAQECHLGCLAAPQAPTFARSLEAILIHCEGSASHGQDGDQTWRAGGLPSGDPYLPPR